jgi:hypothetical protein
VCADNNAKKAYPFLGLSVSPLLRSLDRAILSLKGDMTADYKIYGLSYNTVEPLEVKGMENFRQALYFWLEETELQRKQLGQGHMF